MSVGRLTLYGGAEPGQRRGTIETCCVGTGLTDLQIRLAIQIGRFDEGHTLRLAGNQLIITYYYDPHLKTKLDLNRKYYQEVSNNTFLAKV